MLGYSPESITANVGDMVMFVFMQKNHTATQSSFENPCQRETGGFDSGLCVTSVFRSLCEAKSFTASQLQTTSPGLSLPHNIL